MLVLELVFDMVCDPRVLSPLLGNPCSAPGSVCLCSSCLGRGQMNPFRGRLCSLITMLLLNYLLDKHVITN